MNDTEFEQLLKQRLNQAVDAELGSPRTAPPFKIPPVQHRIRPWLLPLLAAAAVVAVVAGTLGATHALSRKQLTPPASPGPAVSISVAPSPTPATSSPPRHPDTGHPTTVARSTPPAVSLTTLGNAQLALPPGWVARDFHQYLNANSGLVLAGQAWCLTPADIAASTKFEACPLEFLELPLVDKDEVDPAYQGASPSNPEYCTPGRTTDYQHTTGLAEFGGRKAVHYTWGVTCSDTGARHTQEQYVIPTGPGFVFYSGQPADSIGPPLSYLAAHSKLPAASNALPFCDGGTVLSVTKVPGSYRVRIARDLLPVETAGVTVGASQATYYVPDTLNQPELNLLKVGAKLAFYNDGTSTHDIGIDVTSIP